jgi:hypothetical protein
MQAGTSIEVTAPRVRGNARYVLRANFFHFPSSAFRLTPPVFHLPSPVSRFPPHVSSAFITSATVVK